MRLAIAFVLLASAPALAEDDHAVSVQLATLDTSGIGVQAERDLHWKKLSVALGVGVRSAAQGDYDSSTVGFGVELRRWLRRPTAMRGLYIGARTDIARTSITDTMDERAIGTLTTWAFGATFGYRIVIRDRYEFTPSLGAAWVIEGGTAPTSIRRAGLAGITFGVLF